MIATFRYIGSVTGSVTLCSLPMAANSVTPRLRQSRHHKATSRHGHPQRLKVLHFADFSENVTLNVTPSVTPETPINKGILPIVLHLLHL